MKIKAYIKLIERGMIHKIIFDIYFSWDNLEAQISI